jgi:hypothetical protein
MNSDDCTDEWSRNRPVKVLLSVASADLRRLVRAWRPIELTRPCYWRKPFRVDKGGRDGGFYLFGSTVSTEPVAFKQAETAGKAGFNGNRGV